ncbi:hypothetical protein K439DRAFT_1115462 [Ramaria rubella]|nr:hypothetical protein K439DRAFT_1115462 [Ramaria rubella]
MAKSVLQALTLLGLSVAAHSYVISFNNPQQCGVVQIAWTKSSTSAAQLQFPLLLHILPFDSVAITQPIDGWNESMTVGSAMVNFDLRSGTEFLLAVTDQLGQGAGPVSDVKTASASSDTSCLSSTKDSPGHFEVFTTPDAAECPSITVNWDGTVQSSRPTILAFSPELLPVNMDPPLSDAPSDRTVTSNGIFTSMSQVVILFIDINLPGTTSQFLTVGGEDRGSCMSQATNTVATNEGTNTIGSPPPTYSAMAQYVVYLE